MPNRPRRAAIALAAAWAVLLGQTPAHCAGRSQVPDHALYAAIKAEGMERSQAYRFVQDLADGIGPRLTGSPNMQKAYDWSLATMSDMGLAKPRLESIGPFGLSWSQRKTWVRMSAPDSMMLLAQASPWSVSTKGPIEGEVAAVVLANEADLVRHKGSLKGKIVLLGPLRPVPEPVKAFSSRYSEEELQNGQAVAGARAIYKDYDGRLAAQGKENLFRARLRSFLAAEQIKALIVPSRDGQGGGGTGTLAIDDKLISVRSWDKAERAPFPMAYLAIEHFGRAWRLVEAGQPVRLELEIDIEEHGYGADAFNVVAEFPGVDARLQHEIVLAGAHLDSWAAGGGAVDNATGVAAVLEAMRILKAVGFKPRRTIQVVLFTGEEQGLLGSQAYAERHLGRYPRASSPDQLTLPVSQRRKTGPLNREPGYERFSIAYNMDGGTGRLRAPFTGGNPQLAAQFRQWIEPLKELGVSTVYDEPYFPADQSTFTDIGLPGIIFLQDPLDYFTRSHHTNLDTLERVNARDLAQTATVLAWFLANSASTDRLAPRSAPATP